MANNDSITFNGKTLTRTQAAERAVWLGSGMAGADKVAEGDALRVALGWPVRHEDVI